MKTLKHKLPAALALCLAFTIIFTPTDFAFAALDKLNPPALTDRFESTENRNHEYCTGQVSGSRLYLTFRTLIPSAEFRITFYGANPKTGVINPGIYVPARYTGFSSAGKSICGMDYTLDFSDLNLPDGDYFLYISRRASYADQYENIPSKGALYKDMPIRVTDGKPLLMRRDDIIAENDRIRYETAEAPDQYLDTSLEDVRFLLVDPATKIREEMTYDKISFLKRISDRITSGAYTDYDKLLKIFEYTAENFYYDTVAFQTKSLQYANPYRNIYNHENRIKSPNSDYLGRVATTCQGFSGIYLALARAQGIPTRLVFGHPATPPTYTWDTEQNITNRDHWWAESYVDGKWIMTDPTVATNNKWNRNTGVWKYYGITNYTYFNPSKEQEASSHLAFRVYYNTYAGHTLNRQNEISALTRFLQTKSGGITNGRRLNSEYQVKNRKTWGDGITDHFYGNGKGYTAKIIWNNFALAGNADFSDFKRLRILSLADNNLTSLNAKGNGYLRTVDVRNNRLTSVNLADCKKLTSVDTSGNQLEKYTIYANKRNTTVSVKGGRGYINFEYNSSNRYKLRTRFYADLGYKLKGLYRKSNGKKVTSSKTYSMNPVSKEYYAVFAPDPESFKYELRPGLNYGEYKDYNSAAQKRLAELGYFTGSSDGIFDAEMQTAVEQFQLDFNITESPSGVIDKLTWSILFSPDPTPIEPEIPMEPETPIDPEASTETGALTAPENPTEPEASVKLENLTETEASTEPEASVKPEGLTAPESPTEPEASAKPKVLTKSGGLINPNAPALPAAPAKKKEPAKPSKQETSVRQEAAVSSEITAKQQAPLSQEMVDEQRALAKPSGLKIPIRQKVPSKPDEQKTSD